MTKVLIADDHPVVRVGLRQILAEDPQIEVTGEASNFQDVISFVWKNECDIVLLDLSMPGMDGLDAVKELKQMKPELKILIVSIYPEEQYAVRALKAGASGYLTKESAPEELTKAVRKVATGGKYISPTLADILATKISKEREGPLHESLSDREYEVMIMLAKGKTLKEIARELSLSIKTVSTYRSRILRKMGFKNNAQITLYAVKNGLIL